MFFSGNKVVPVNPLVDFNSSSLFQTAGDFTTPFFQTPTKKWPPISHWKVCNFYGEIPRMSDFINQPTKAWLHLFVIANGLILYTAPRIGFVQLELLERVAVLVKKFQNLSHLPTKSMIFWKIMTDIWNLGVFKPYCSMTITDAWNHYRSSQHRLCDKKNTNGVLYKQQSEFKQQKGLV